MDTEVLEGGVELAIELAQETARVCIPTVALSCLPGIGFCLSEICCICPLLLLNLTLEMERFKGNVCRFQGTHSYDLDMSTLDFICVKSILFYVLL